MTEINELMIQLINKWTKTNEWIGEWMNECLN